MDGCRRLRRRLVWGEDRDERRGMHVSSEREGLKGAIVFECTRNRF